MRKISAVLQFPQMRALKREQVVDSKRETVLHYQASQSDRLKGQRSAILAITVYVVQGKESLIRYKQEEAMLKITGLDKLQKELKEAEQALNELDHYVVVIEDKGTWKLFIALVLCLHEFCGTYLRLSQDNGAASIPT